MSYILSILTFLPLAGAILILLLPKNDFLTKMIALFTSLLTFVVSVPLFMNFDSSVVQMQFVQKFDWVASFGISYYLGVDGISLLLVLLTAFLTPLAILISFHIKENLKGFMACMLFLEMGMMGVFLSLDLFLFYIFWEAMLIPMYFLIGIWGGNERIYAATKFFLYTMVGSVLMLVAILTLYFLNGKATGIYTFDLLTLYNFNIPIETQTWLFLAFALAFAIKVPLFPFHTWLPHAHVQAPTAGSVILAGVLLKMGTYGFIRFCLPLFPSASVEFAPLFITLGVVGIIYGALVAMVQPDMKKLVAYSSVSHLGFVVLGIFALNTESLSGSILQMINHGISTGALFLCVGMIYERRHTRMISDFGGIAKQVPVFTGIFLVVCLSSLGLPGTNGFVGEFLILFGAYEKYPAYVAFASTGVILAAVYLLWMFQRVMFGETTHKANLKLEDVTKTEIVILAPLLVLIFMFGVYPKPFLKIIEPSVKQTLELMNSKHAQAEPQKPLNQFAESK
ncbi:NADH-quinone oxidoreductase subunit M [bacterium]|nr:NADH-quinone oxidoreductase subunit M [bacterium]